MAHNQRISDCSIGQTHFLRSVLTLMLVSAGVLITFVGDVAAHAIDVTIDPGDKFGLGDWVAQQQLDLTGAMALLGSGATPHEASVRVHECDQAGKVIAPRPSQFDLESREPLIGTVSWRVGATPAGQPRHFRISWSDHPPDEPAPELESSLLSVSNSPTGWVIRNETYEVTHDQSRGGLWSRLVFRSSGKVTDQTIWRDGFGDYELRHDSTPEVRVVASGPLRVVVEVKARYLNEQGQAPPSNPHATYRYTYLAGQIHVRIETTIEQDEPIAWSELRIGDVRPDTSFFTKYWMDHFSGKGWNKYGDLVELGSFTTLRDNKGILLGDRAFFALAGPMVKFWDAGKNQDSYLRVHWEPWHTKRMQYTFHALLDGSEDGYGRIVGRAHTIHTFMQRHLGSEPPRVVLDVKPLRKEASKLLSTYNHRRSALSTLPPVRNAVANFALHRARVHLVDADVALNGGAFGRVRDLFQAASDEAQKTVFENLIWRTKVRTGDAQGLETDNLLILINRDLAIAIDREELKLRGFFNLATQKEFVSISRSAPPPDLVGVTLLTPDHRAVDASGYSKSKHTHEWRQTNDGVGLVLRWQGIDVPHEPNVIDVEAIIQMGPEGMTQWSCQVRNRSRDLGLRSIKFPVIGPLHAGTDEDPSDYNGSGSPNPTARTGEGGLGHAYYGSRGGVYYHPQDSQWYEKRTGGRVDGATRTGTYEHSYIAVNSHGEQVKSFDPTYKVAVGVFEGDWYDVARIYRRWAVTQPWCAKGTIAQRDDLPQWFKELDFFDQGGAETQEQFDANLQLGHNYNRVDGYHGPIGIWMTHWMQHKFDNKYPDYFPALIGEEAFKQSVAKGHKLGVYYMPYVNAFIYATNAPSFTEQARQNAAMTLDGRRRGGVIAYSKHYMPFVTMCPATKFWQDKFSEIGRKIIQQYDCDGMYYDQVDPYREECGDPSHGHPIGGGNSWTAGVREMYDRVRRESLAAGKKIVFSSEYWCEPYIGTCDMALQQYSTADTRSEFISQVIYHDYIQTYGYAHLSQPFFPYVGWLYLAGVYGPTNLSSNKNLGGDDPNPDRLKFMHYLSECRRTFGAKYLNLGARLRDPVILTDLPLVDRGQKRGGARMRPVPAVITSAWEAGDGDIGCFFMNISEKTQTFEYEIELSRFALESMGTYSVIKRELGRDKTLHEDNPGILRMRDTLETGKLFLIEFSPRP